MIESLNGRLRDKSLNVNEFATLGQATAVLMALGHDYNPRRPHGPLGNQTPRARTLVLSRSKNGLRSVDRSSELGGCQASEGNFSAIRDYWSRFG
jgi:hypothetical protein